MIDGKNISFPIFSSNGQSFHGLILHNATYDSVVMSLGDKITGDVYYVNNTLNCTMHEYIIYNGVHYSLVNPPTIVREGMVSDNSDLKGMTRYSFEFYHPMYMLSNLPFTDVAVDDSENQYKSQDKNFYWVGYFKGFIDKINKNLENTEWVCDINPEVLAIDSITKKISDVLTFDKNSIADALKTEFDTWGVPFIIDEIADDDESYDEGKKYLIYFGNPVNEIYASAEDRENDTPFVFQFGKDVGLKNNSATPKNNKIVTRLAGYGSERNIPFGYPQIRWYGDSRWDFTEYQGSTINYDSNGKVTNSPTTTAYPIYKGILNGEWVKLIKHPFTRKTLMPSVYVESVFNKVSPYASDGTANPNYDTGIELVDYHDASDSSVYPHTINPLAPSYEIHQFEDIFPELGVKHIVDAYPVEVTEIPENLTPLTPVTWDDSTDDEGNYLQSYFVLTLPQLDFDLYACASITEEMQINMRTGACIGCTFNVQIDWEDYKYNFYDIDGNFVPNGQQRNLIKYPKSNQGSISVLCQKDNNTFGVLMPNAYQYPKGASVSPQYDGDEFVILGISLPQSYITTAQGKLDDAMDEYMLENNVYYYEYPLKFDEYFLANHTYILNQIKNNTIVRFVFGNESIPLYVKQITIKYGESPLPQYNITLTDDVDIVLSKIGQVTEDVSRMRVEVSALQTYLDKNLLYELQNKLSKIHNDTSRGKITFLQGWDAGDYLANSSGSSLYSDEYGNWHLETDYLNIRKKLEAAEVEILKTSHIGGVQILTPASIVISSVEPQYDNNDNIISYRCYFDTEDGNGNEVYNTFDLFDQARCQTFNLTKDENGVTGNHYWWRLVVSVGANYIDVSNMLQPTVNGATYSGYQYGSGIPRVGDRVTSLGNQFYESRQNAIMLAGAGSGNPYIRLYKGINSFSLPSNKVAAQISPSGSWITVTGSDGNEYKVEDYIDLLNEKIDSVQEQNDQQMVLWFGDEVPTLLNEPASNWRPIDYPDHVHDMYYNRSGENGGRAYEFVLDNAVYKWVEITNQDILEALERANNAQDTADGKRRVFVSTPTVPYDVGDLWVNATYPSTGTPVYSNEILVCKIAEPESGAFTISDWQRSQTDWKSEITQTANTIDLSITNLTNNLETAGIHIDGANSKITLNAATTEVSDDLIVNRLITAPDIIENENNQAKIVIDGSSMEVFGSTGIRNIQFGVDENGYAVLKYFDNDGTMLYDLGPEGLRQLEIQNATFKYYTFYTDIKTNMANSTHTVRHYQFKAKRLKQGSTWVITGDTTYASTSSQAEGADGKWFDSSPIYSGNTLINLANDNTFVRYAEDRIVNLKDSLIPASTSSEFRTWVQTEFSPNQEDGIVSYAGTSQDGIWVLSNDVYVQQVRYFVNGAMRSKYIIWQ